jgi:hypothetical protein
MDYKNFYNNSTHTKHYATLSLKKIFNICCLKTVFIKLELVEKRWFWREVTNKIKWFIASQINSGVKSIISFATKAII